MVATKVVLIIGAGATFAEVYSGPEEKKPPLDKKFFLCAKSSYGEDVNLIKKIFIRKLLYEYSGF